MKQILEDHQMTEMMKEILVQEGKPCPFCQTKLGAEEGYLLILEKNENIALFGSKSIDPTDRVIKAYHLQRK